MFNVYFMWCTFLFYFTLLCMYLFISSSLPIFLMVVFCRSFRNLNCIFIFLKVIWNLIRIFFLLSFPNLFGIWNLKFSSPHMFFFHFHFIWVSSELDRGVCSPFFRAYVAQFVCSIRNTDKSKFLYFIYSVFGSVSSSRPIQPSPKIESKQNIKMAILCICGRRDLWDEIRQGKEHQKNNTIQREREGGTERENQRKLTKNRNKELVKRKIYWNCAAKTF